MTIEPTRDADAGRRVVAYVPDLMDRSRLRGVELVGSLDALVARAAEDDLVVIDLARPGAVEAAGRAVAAGAAVVGFAPHVDDALLAEVAALGVTALPRSRFFSRWPDV